jgi:hypothetical protein
LCDIKKREDFFPSTLPLILIKRNNNMLAVVGVAWTVFAIVTFVK